MNTKQELVLDLIARWADRFECIKAVVIYGSVARGDERLDSDLDVDLEFVSDLSGAGMLTSYTDAQRSFDELDKDVSRAIGHALQLSNYVIGRQDNVARTAIAQGREIGALRKARIVATSHRPFSKR
jgi:predicted nucleotidyltransferase